MQQFKHYSFDLWLTLIKSNPEYKPLRSKYFFEHFNTQKKSLQEVDGIIRAVEKKCDYTNQLTGGNIHAIEMIAMILFDLQYDSKGFKTDDVVAILHMMQQQFSQCPPLLYDGDTLNVIEELKSRGSTISILSNTGFILGNTLIPFLSKIGILQHLSFVHFSDQFGLSKPNPEFFKMMSNAAFINLDVAKRDILHVGDNNIADIIGAKRAGINAYQINSNKNTIKDLIQ